MLEGRRKQGVKESAETDKNQHLIGFGGRCENEGSSLFSGDVWFLA